MAEKKSPSAELIELASKIDAHLKRTEKMPGSSLYRAGAFVRGRFIVVSYVSYHSTTNLCRDAAKIYVAKLATRKGDMRHYEALVGTPWEHDSTGLGKAARARSDARIKQKQLESDEADRSHDTHHNTIGMELAAEIVDALAREQDNPGARRLLVDAAAKIRKAANAMLVAGRKTGT